MIATYVRAPRGARPAPTGLGELTPPREVEVWHLMATSLDNTGISRALDISLSTVKNYITSIFDKPAVRDRAQAVVAAYESGLVTARAAAGDLPGDGHSGTRSPRPAPGSSRHETRHRPQF
ncbi:response regulator transcription factor [Streptomyces atratus]|uniref:response regulator transcription factor n=1 Tax=Streptomyces atratus TaxID=1893 RepID=UPI002B1E0076|nr:LuxR C-terminal-related transcriptional regulator [Streptomyces atratus]